MNIGSFFGRWMSGWSTRRGLLVSGAILGAAVLTILVAALHESQGHLPNATVGIAPDPATPSVSAPGFDFPPSPGSSTTSVVSVAPVAVHAIQSASGQQLLAGTNTAGGASSSPNPGGPAPTTTTSAPPNRSSGWQQEALPAGTQALQAISCVNAQDCWAGGYSGIVATTDGGRTWGSRSIPALAGSDYVSGISCVDTSTCWAATSTGRMYHSTDGGATWTEQKVPSGGIQALTCIDGQHCWAAGGPNGVEYTSDAGNSWTGPTTPPCSGCTLHGITCATAATCWVVGSYQASDGTTRPGIWGSTDGGQTWSQQTAPGSAGVALAGISCANARDCMAVGAGLVVSTSDGGASWTRDAVPAAVSTAVSCAGTGSCWVIGGGRVAYRSGPTAPWALQQQYDPASTTPAALDCVPSGQCWAAGAVTGKGGAGTSRGVILAGSPS